MWAIPSDLEDTSFPVSVTKSDAMAYSWPTDPAPIRVAVTPLDDIEALVERVALALINSARGKDGMAKVGQFYKFPKDSQDFYLNYARAALTAAGIPCKQRRARK